MTTDTPVPVDLVNVNGTRLLSSDTRELYRQKLARITLDSMVQFVGLLDANGTVLEINKVALDAVGIKLSEVEGKPFWTTFWWSVSEQIRGVLRESIARAAQGEFVRWDTEIYGRAGGKETIVIDASLCPVTDVRGKVVFITAEGRDISAKKAQEREIAQKNEELQALLVRIKELDEIKNQFFANVSHELRTPLALILGPVERLKRAETDQAERSEIAEMIARNARMLLKHVNDLLDISKLEAGKLHIELRATDVAALLRFVLSHFEVLASERQIDFSVQVPEHLLEAVDPEKLERVLMNLVSNAFKFVPAGGVVRCMAQVSRESVIIAVEDSGPGVRPELREAIFERFRQGDGGSSRQFGGTGLGLAIAREFVELHRGTLQVRDSALGGALFEITLPRRLPEQDELPETAASARHVDANVIAVTIDELRTPASSQPGSKAPAASHGERARVLVVEDNAEMNRFICEALADDYQVRSAFDGEEGLAAALSFDPALIITDIMMPKVSGAQMIAGIRARPELQHARIVVLSAKADEELRIRLLEQGAQDFIVKPFSEGDLLVRVRNLIAARQAQEALRVQSQYLSDLFQRAPGFMAVVHGPRHVFELANAAYLTLVGHRDVIGKPFLDALPEFAVQEFPALLDQVFTTAEPYVGRARKVLLQRSPGARLEERYLDFVYQPLLAADGSVSGVFIEGSDVSERCAAEEALRQADRRKDEFLATLAHELRNPLSPIRHAAKIAQNSSVTPAQLQWSHDVIDRQVEHMSRLLDDLLDISRITRGKLELRTQHLALMECITAAVESTRPLIEAKQHRIEIEVRAEEPIHIEADPVRIVQIFSNLLTNAAKYTDSGGRISVSVRAVGKDVEISVRDNGIGIAADVLPQVFVMFSQATSALERSEGGLGIGLSLVRGLVILHSGSIEAHSEGLGRGSEFVVRLPRSRTLDASDSTVARQSAPKAFRPLRILVADDNRDSADSCQLLLEASGHTVRAAYGGAEAVDVAGNFQPEVALLDIGMPRINGFEVARRIRAMPWGPGAMLIAVTGWGQEQDKRQSLSAGFDRHLTKPIDIDALVGLLEGRASQPDHG